MCESSFLIWICNVIKLRIRMSPSLSRQWGKAAANSFNLRSSSQCMLLHISSSLFDASRRDDYILEGPRVAVFMMRPLLLGFKLKQRKQSYLTLDNPILSHPSLTFTRSLGEREDSHMPIRTSTNRLRPHYLCSILILSSEAISYPKVSLQYCYSFALMHSPVEGLSLCLHVGC